MSDKPGKSIAEKLAFRNERLATEALKAQAELGLRADAQEPHASAREQLLQLYRTRHAAFGCFEADSAGRNTWGEGAFEALGWICRLEEAGHVGAARLLDRVKPPPDDALALAWYERGLAFGSAKCLIGWLSACVRGKLGLVPDPDTAFERVQRFIAAGGAVESIEQSTVTAIREIGKSHLERDGAKPDPALAAKWLQVGALLGDSVACYQLGTLYANGHGVAQDREVARNWLEKAQEMLARYQRGSALGSVKCLSRWLSACVDGESGPAPDPDAVLKGVEQFIAAGGDVELVERSIRGAVGNIGKSHRESHIAEADPVLHAKWLQVGALLGDSGTCGSLGLCYAHGLGVSRDPEVARVWMKRCKIMDEKLIQVLLDEGDPASPNYIGSAPGTSTATPAQADAGSREASQKLDFERDAANVYASWEVETRLDLAKANFEMGDPEGARDLLMEVLDSGDDGQQARARELMKRC